MCLGFWRAYTLIERSPRSPRGSAVNIKEEIAIAANSAIIHDESNAETLLILEKTLCILMRGQKML